MYICNKRLNILHYLMILINYVYMNYQCILAITTCTCIMYVYMTCNVLCFVAVLVVYLSVFYPVLLIGCYMYVSVCVLVMVSLFHCLMVYNITYNYILINLIL